MKKYLLLIIFLGIVSIIVSCNEGGVATNEDTAGSIYGIVTTDGEPLKGIKVSLCTSTQEIILSTITYNDGSYEFIDLKAGRYIISVEAEGYEAAQSVVLVEAGRRALIDIKLTVLNTHITVITAGYVIIPQALELVGNYRYDSIADSQPSMYKPKECGFYYSENKNSVLSGTQVRATGSSWADYGLQEFKVTVTGLPDGTYYFQAYCVSNAGITYGEVKEIKYKSVKLSDYVVVLEEDGIMVQKTDISSGTDANNAYSLCYQSRVAGFSDWRVPTISEIQALYKKRNSIGGFSNATYWSDTRDYYYIYAWDFRNGVQVVSRMNSHGNSDENYRVRAVRTIK